MTTHPASGHCCLMTSIVDLAAEKTAPLAYMQAQTELTERFVRDVPPLLDYLHATARRMTRNASDAEDLVQETVTKAYEHFGSFQQGTNLSAWLRRIMTNTYISGLRWAQRHPIEYMGEQFTDRQLAQHQNRYRPREPRSAEIDALEALGDNEIAEAFATLPPTHRLTVYYRDVEGLRYREIAHIMGCPPGTVMSRLHRGHLRLRNLLSHRHQLGLADSVGEIDISDASSSE